MLILIKLPTNLQLPNLFGALCLIYYPVTTQDAAESPYISLEYNDS